MNGKKLVFIYFVFALVLYLFPLNTVLAHEEIGIPSITNINQSGQYAIKPLISGTTPHGTEVLIYLDGTWQGFAKIDNTIYDLDVFSFQIKESLITGKHVIMAVAKDPTSLVLSPPSKEYFIETPNVPAPTIVGPTETSMIGSAKPLFTGLTVSGSIVQVYIDDIYNGKTDILFNDSGTANFTYHPYLDLPVGLHNYYLVAENQMGTLSKPSRTVEFRVLLPTPAPIIYKPIINKKDKNKPIIIGIAKNDSNIKIYIDKNLVGEKKVMNNSSGTGNFSFIPDKTLTKGQHFVYTEAYDTRGKVSQWSNTVYFTTSSVNQPKISNQAVEERPTIKVTPIPEKKTEVKKKTNPKTQIKKPQPKEEPKKKTEKTDNEGLQNLLNNQNNAKATGTGIINENKAPQSKLQTNFIVFILFLIAVIAWIFWVNRELIREKKEKEETIKDKEQ